MVDNYIAITMLQKANSLTFYTSKSKTNNLVSSIPFLLPTAQTSFLSLHFTRQTTPPVKWRHINIIMLTL